MKMGGNVFFFTVFFPFFLLLSYKYIKNYCVQEDLPEGQQEHLATKAYGSGLQNLGNT